MRIHEPALRQALADFPPGTFERKFWKRSLRLGLDESLDGRELLLLRRAAFLATLCRIAFNGLGGCGGKIRPEREHHRMHLERRFMVASDAFFACAGWEKLDTSRREQVRRRLLSVVVADENLAE